MKKAKSFEEFFINDLKSMMLAYLVVAWSVTSFFLHVLISLMRIKEDNLSNISTKTSAKIFSDKRNFDIVMRHSLTLYDSMRTQEKEIVRPNITTLTLDYEIIFWSMFWLLVFSFYNLDLQSPLIPRHNWLVSVFFLLDWTQFNLTI